MLKQNQLLCLTLVASLGALTACPGGNAPDEGGPGAMSGPPPVAVMLEPVQLRDYAPAVDLVGDIRAAQQATLSAEVSGRVVEINKRLGQSWIPTDGPLIRIDPSTYSAALKGEIARLAQVQQNLTRLENGPRQQEIAAQEAQVESARAMQGQAQDNYFRQKKLFADGVISEQAVVVAKSNADAAQAGVDAASELLDSLLEGSRSEDLAAAQAAVNAAQSQVDLAALNLARTAVTPAFGCDIASLLVEVGSYVGPGTPLVEVVSSGSLEAWLNLPEAEVGSVKVGDTLEVRSDSIPGQVFQATVLAVSPLAAPGTRQFALRASVEGDGLKPGMAIDGRLLKGEPQEMVFISVDATVMGPLGLVAYTMTPAAEGELPGVQMVPIVTGEILDDMVVVLEGELQPGMMVVTQGNEQLYPGAKIIPVNLPMGGEEPGGAGRPGAPPGADDAESEAEPADEAPGTEGE